MDTINQEDKKNLRHNIIANIGDGGFFGFGVGFASYSTVIPLFVATITPSATLIGLIPAIHNMGWQLPQLLIANRIAKMERMKPFVLFMTIQERLPILGLAFVALFLPRLGTNLALALTFLLLVWQGLGAGFTANAWQILISKVIPDRMRATFFGSQAAAANLLASLGAFIAGVLLTKLKPPFDFATCFFIASGLYVISWFSLRMTREKPRVVDKDSLPPIPLWENVAAILKRDFPFRNFIWSRIISQFGMMAFAFYTVFAVNEMGMSTLTVGIMTSILMITQVIANPLLGRLADKWSRKWVLVLGSFCSVLSAFFALIVKDANLFSIVFILCGVANTAFWTIGMTLSLDFGDETQKPTYVGMSNTLIAPSTILAPLLGGFLADSFGYSTTFIISALLGLVSVFVLITFVRDPSRHSAAPFQV